MELIGKQIAIETILGQPPELHYPSWYAAQIEKLPPAPPEYLAEQAGILVTDADTISRQAAIMRLRKLYITEPKINNDYSYDMALDQAEDAIKQLPPAQPDLGKYEYHYDHTDCIWYRPEARNRCPVTCAQYRDGWNDAMNYIFRDGKGYRPYRRGKQYEE